MASKWILEKENLEKFINEGVSYEEIGRKYNCSGSNIKKVAERIGISLPNRRTINPCEDFHKEPKIRTCINCGKEFIGYSSTKFCSHECSTEYKHKQNYAAFLEGNESIMRANYNPRTFKEDILKEQGGVCAICGCKPEHNGKPLVFILDHIDGHAANNRRDNLRCVCPNCDSQLDTYKSKNKNGDRIYHRLNHR